MKNEGKNIWEVRRAKTLANINKIKETIEGRLTDLLLWKKCEHDEKLIHYVRLIKEEWMGSGYKGVYDDEIAIQYTKVWKDVLHYVSVHKNDANTIITLLKTLQDQDADTRSVACAVIKKTFYNGKPYPEMYQFDNITNNQYDRLYESSIIILGALNELVDE